MQEHNVEKSGHGVSVEARSSGAELIARERQRQIEVEGWTPEHDAAHTNGSLAAAAICYAAPFKVYRRDHYANSEHFVDPWPWPGEYCDKRHYTVAAKSTGNVLPDPKSYTNAERVDLLVKAGALIAAEIDRIQTSQPEGQNASPATESENAGTGQQPENLSPFNETWLVKAAEPKDEG